MDDQLKQQIDELYQSAKAEIDALQDQQENLVEEYIDQLEEKNLKDTHAALRDLYNEKERT